MRQGASHRAPRMLTPDSWLLRYTRSYPGRPDQVRHVRAFLRDALTAQPRADDAVLVGSELAANACIHSRSGLPGGMFTVQADVSEGDYLHVEVEDQGGPWDLRTCGVRRQHGLGLVQALAGADWGVKGGDGGRVVWARLHWPRPEHLVARAGQAGAAPGQPDEEAAELRRQAAALAAALADRALAADLAIRPDGLPYLAVYAPEAPALPERVYPQAGWFFWRAAERIADCDDPQGAAAEIARVLRGTTEAAHA
jgi:serine/threonine-protein kinase RsbW